MRTLLRIVAFALGLWLLLTSPWVFPVIGPYVADIPVVHPVTEAGVSLWQAAHLYGSVP